MTKPDIIPLTNEQVPTILSYDEYKNSFIIGHEARELGLKGRTNIFNFKPDLGKGDKEFSQKRKYWVSPLDYKPGEAKTLSAKEAVVNYVGELMKTIIELPREVIIGEPAIRDDAWKENFRRHMREVFDELGLGSKVQFFPEPFAVFQYYRHYEKIFPAVKSPEIVLIIDIGGGTFNSCIIRTTNEGNLSRSGATMLPLGLKAELLGGSYIDMELVKIIVGKARKKGIRWHDDPIKNAEIHGSVLLHVENAKIELSKATGINARLADDFSHLKTSVVLAANTLHPEKEISEELSGEDLKLVIRTMWRKFYSNIINATIIEAKNILKKQKYTFEKIDRVLIAGGSSLLPFMKEEIFTLLPTMVNRENIYIGSAVGSAVAVGIACECREQIKKYPELSVNRLAPCLINDLYLGFRKSRRDPIEVVKVNIGNIIRNNGQLFISPFEIEDNTKVFDIELPFEIKSDEKIFYCFNDTPFQENSIEAEYINRNQDVFSVKTAGKIKRTCRLQIDIKQNGFLRPTFIIQEKGLGTKKGDIRIECPEIFFDNLKVNEGYPFLGIDFGTSNSYVARFLSLPKELKAAEYPEFTVKPFLMEKLRQLEIDVRRFKAENVFNRQSLLEHAQNRTLLMVFHSNKIEGSPLTQGETELVLKKSSGDGLNKNQREAYNIQNAYNWVLENYESYKLEPDIFIRQINKILLADIEREGGNYRKSAVKIAGMNFIPPHSASIPSFMEKLGTELKTGPEGRSIIEFAASMHSKLVYIHPFIDANGRTARLLTNAIMLANDLPVIIVNFADKQRYLNALEQSNEGDLSTLVEFFIECFVEQLEEIKKIPEEHVLHAIMPSEQELDIREKARIEDPITEALSEIALEHAVDPLWDIMRNEIEILREASYEGWKQAFNALLVETKIIAAWFNENLGFKYRISVREYDMLPFEKFKDICSGKRVSKTWFFTVEITDAFFSKQRMLFLFERIPSPIEKKINVSKVCLSILRFDGTMYQRLTSEPIKIRKVAYMDGDIVFIDNEDKLLAKDEKRTVNHYLKYIIADILKSYFIEQKKLL